MRNVDQEHKIYHQGFAAGKEHSRPSPLTTKFMEETKEVNARQEERMNNIEKHIEVTNEELGSVKKDIGEIKVDVAQVKTDLTWLKKFFWIIATSSIGSLIGSFFVLLFR